MAVAMAMLVAIVVMPAKGRRVPPWILPRVQEATAAAVLAAAGVARRGAGDVVRRAAAVIADLATELQEQLLQGVEEVLQRVDAGDTGA